MNTTTLKPTANPLNEELYWQMINKSIKNSNNETEQITVLSDEILNLSPEELIGFRLRTDKLLYDSYSADLWCAGYLMNGGCSDDGFEYFRLWIISKGQDVYLKANKNPDSLAEILPDDPKNHWYELEEFNYIANEIFEDKTQQNLYDFIDYENFKTCESNYPQIKFNWDELKPETMKAICPRIFNKCW